MLIVKYLLIAKVRIAKCECPGAWKGEFCEIGPCHQHACFQNVTCTVTNDGLNFTCGPCPVMKNIIFEGDGVNCFRMLRATFLTKLAFEIISSLGSL